MTNQELLRRPEIFTNREETDYAEQELIEMIKQDSVLIIGNVFDWDDQRRGLRVSFGKGLLGFIPEDEITIRNMRYQRGFKMPKDAFFLIGKNIIAEVTNHNVYRREFELSRKMSMKKSISVLKAGDIVEAAIESINEKAMILDVGAGNLAWMSWKDFSKVPYNSIDNIGFEKGEWLNVFVDSIKDTRIQVSRKKAFRDYEEARKEYQENENIVAMITDYRNSEDHELYEFSYWVEIEPNVPGILDTHKALPIGKIADLRILSVKDKGLKLRLTS